MRGVVRNKNITEFKLEPHIDDQEAYTSDQQVVDGMLAQLTADERRKFKVGRDSCGDPSIELCPVGEWCIVSLLMQCLWCLSSPQSVVSEKQHLIPQLAVLGWVGLALSCV